MVQFISLLKSQIQNRTSQIFILLFVILGLFIISDKKEEVKDASIETADTYIPKNHVLVPIELHNSEAISSMIGAYGIVDLFTVSENLGDKGKKVGRRLKILRAPLNPEKFAVLVHENESAGIVGHAGSFIAVIQNVKNKEKTEITQRQAPKQSRVNYYGGK